MHVLQATLFGSLLAAALDVSTAGPSPAAALNPVKEQAVVVAVSGRSNPWDQRINPLMSYSSDAFAPVVWQLDEHGIAAGSVVTIRCAGGTTNAGGVSDSGCDGLKGMFPPSNDTFQPACQHYYPSKYQDPSTYDTWVFQVIGVFTDAKGLVIGKPFPLSSAPISVIVPPEASRLQFGMNDCLNSDNSSSPLLVEIQLSNSSSVEKSHRQLTEAQSEVNSTGKEFETVETPAIHASKVLDDSAPTERPVAPSQPDAAPAPQKLVPGMAPSCRLGTPGCEPEESASSAPANSATPVPASQEVPVPTASHDGVSLVGFTMSIIISIILASVLLGIAYIANIVKLFTRRNQGLGKVAVRVVGIFIPVIGIIAGFF